jgi:hypothetical protein
VADQPKKKPISAIKRNDSRKNGKAFKTTPDAFFSRGKSYRGSHTRGTRVNEVQKVLLGGGMLRNTARVHGGSVQGAWRFGGMPNGPFDTRQVLENRLLYPHLFTD